MPSHDPRQAVGLEEARRRIATTAFRPDQRPRSPGLVGLEPEFLVLRTDAGGRPTARVGLEEPGGVLDGLTELGRHEGRFRRAYGGPPPVFTLGDGGRITFEPGAQIEHSTATHASAALAMADVERTAGAIAASFEARGVALAACGIDLWHEVSGVPQQLHAPRYHSMAAYFARRGPEGAVMMRHTASLQINLDLGSEGEAGERWLVANLASPIATASFASSPRDGFASRRALAWQRLDPTRTGFPAALVSGAERDPGRQYADFALEADVLLFLNDELGAVPGRPGFSLRRWIEEGHGLHGRPTAADVDYHLTTLFPEVRLRGFLELRGVDALPQAWRAAVVVFWTGLVYDGRARHAALARLDGVRARLPELWIAAARTGLRDGELGPLAQEIWCEALAGAARLPSGFHRSEDLDCARAFFERYVVAGRSPSEELGELHASDPRCSLEWSRERAGSVRAR